MTARHIDKDYLADRCALALKGIQIARDEDYAKVKDKLREEITRRRKNRASIPVIGSLFNGTPPTEEELDKMLDSDGDGFRGSTRWQIYDLRYSKSWDDINHIGNLTLAEEGADTVLIDFEDWDSIEGWAKFAERKLSAIPA